MAPIMLVLRLNPPNSAARMLKQGPRLKILRDGGLSTRLSCTHIRSSSVSSRPGPPMQQTGVALREGLAAVYLCHESNLFFERVS